MVRTNASEEPGKPDLGVNRIDWGEALARHDRWLRTVVYARLGEPQAVDDVMQEVSLAAIRQSAPLSDPAKLAPWLYRLAVTQTLMYRRTQGRRRKRTDRYAERNRPTEADCRETDPLGWLLADERRDRVRQALAMLGGRDAELLMLKYTEDWNYRDMAQRLGISEAALQARLHRARQRFRDALTSLDVVESPAT